MKTKSIFRRFFEKMTVSETKFYEGSACWEWTGAIGVCRYGAFVAMGTRMAHRVSFMLFVGAIPEDKEIDHKCNNRRCVNPLHLQLLTHKENILRRYENHTHCPRGHEYTAENTQLTPRKDGTLHKKCRACNRLFVKAHKERQKAHTR